MINYFLFVSVRKILENYNIFKTSSTILPFLSFPWLLWFYLLGIMHNVLTLCLMCWWIGYVLDPVTIADAKGIVLFFQYIPPEKKLWD